MPGTLKLKSEAGGSVILAANTTAASDLTVSVPPFAGTMATLVANTTGPVFSVPNVAGNGPTFSAYATTSQTVSSGVGTKVIFQGTYWNTGNCYDPTTNYRFTPTVAGYYQFNAGIGIGSNTAGERQLSIYKNGSEWKRGTDSAGSGATPYQMNVSRLVYFNGTTDYVESRCFLNSGSSQNIGGGGGYIPATYFDGCMVRSA